MLINEHKRYFQDISSKINLQIETLLPELTTWKKFELILGSNQWDKKNLIGSNKLTYSFVAIKL